MSPTPSPSPAGIISKPFATSANALSMRLAPLSALAAAVILIPLAMFANHELARSLRTQADSRLAIVAKRYAALTMVVTAERPGSAGPASLTADSALRSTLQGVFATGSVSEIGVELADSSGKMLIASRNATSDDLRAYAAAVRMAGDTAFTYVGSRGPERGALATANLGQWVILAHETVVDNEATYRVVRVFLVGLAVFLFAIMVAIGFAVDHLVNRRIRQPAMELAALAEAVAAGDLTVRVTGVRSTDEIERLARALSKMVGELGRLARALTDSAHETATMSSQITTSSEEMSSSASQIAHTASDLSTQSGAMAESIQSLAASAVRLAPLAASMDAGAHEGVARNARLRDLALESRRQMDDSTTALAILTDDVAASAAAVRALVDASQEIRTFVTLVQALARHSKLLALNAAMEAARAGEQGEGFSVVAAEVRRLSAMSSDAAERTQRVVAEVLAGVERSSESMDRMAATARDVRRATEQGSASFRQLETSVAELEAWTSSIEQAAASTNTVVREITDRLDAIARGTETFAAAMQQVAAASEQQSASTEEIAAAAGTMAHAAERLARLVSNLRIGEARPSGETRTGRTSGPGPVRTDSATSGASVLR